MAASADASVTTSLVQACVPVTDSVLVVPSTVIAGAAVMGICVQAIFL